MAEDNFSMHPEAVSDLAKVFGDCKDQFTQIKGSTVPTVTDARDFGDEWTAQGEQFKTAISGILANIGNIAAHFGEIQAKLEKSVELTVATDEIRADDCNN